MGRHSWTKHEDDPFEDHHPGCMWGIIHALDYHHWHYNVKKMLPHRKKNGRRHSESNGSPKTRLNFHDPAEVEKLLDTSYSPVNQSTARTSSMNKRSRKSRIKALIAEERSKDEDYKRLGSGSPARSSFRRTFPIHHLDPSDHGLDEICTAWKHPINFLDADVSATRLQDPALTKATDKPVTCEENFDVGGTKDAMGYLEHNQLTGNHTLGDCFRGRQTSNRKAKLTKSGSFPLVDSSSSRNFRPSQLEDKQNEIWSFPKEERLLPGTQAPKLDACKYSKNLSTKSGSLMADDSGGGMLNQETSFISSVSLQESDKQGNNKVVVPLKDIEKRAELNEGRNRSNGASLDANLDSIPNGYSPSASGTEMAEMWKESAMDEDGKGSSSSCHKFDCSVSDLSKGKPTHRRTPSINGSLDRYAQLFEYGFSRKDKWHLSKSLKLRNEYELSSSGYASISLRRINSLPHLDSYYSVWNEVTGDPQFSGLPIRNVVDNGRNIGSSTQDKPEAVGLPMITEMHVMVDDNEETERLNNMVGTSDSSRRMEYPASLKVGIITDESTTKMDGLPKEIDELTKAGESNSHNEQEITSTEIANNKLQKNPISVVGSCSQEEVASTVDNTISEGLECRCNEKETSLNSPNKSDADVLPWSCSSINPEIFENPNPSVENCMSIGSYTKDDADLNYVREILERSGFIRNGFQGAWYSSEQPLNPSVLEELEACWPHESECSGEDICACCRHQLLFDLINEVLVQIYDRSFKYYPKALSSTCRIRPMPVGYHVLEEVRTGMSGILNLKLDLDRALDFVVAQDLAQDDGWMNLQLESECVALELEDLIFDELLEDIICSGDH